LKRWTALTRYLDGGAVPLIQTAKINGLNPQAYLKDVLERLPAQRA
jgi:hypothetical protein